ncbi:hypothetical protein [Aureispira anguillae]|uniref:Uncharacterized protein n=1 Tax=Aureispira anguillae TaxID=2864201 RepID=A0A916DWF3_9BACT|nr:hypothetical protein [Aureispira anguillae]BDS15411.1 hypothetical protein AsAng_0061950 [Aureispira anguillae]
MQAINYIILIITIGLLSSCGNETLIPSDYVAWVNNPENGLLRKKTIHPLEVELLYKPIAYVIANEMRTNDIAEADYKQREKELAGMQYYTLKLSTAGGKDITTYQVNDNAQQQERLSYLSFAMQKDIKLIEGTDTLPCKLYHFERSYDLAAHRTFVLGFEQKEATKTANKTLVLDLPYFQTGPIKLNYKTSALEAIPNLKL